VWPRTSSLRFTIEADSATAAPFSPTRSHTQCRCSRTFLCRAAPEKDAFALAWRACRSGRRAGSPPSLQNPYAGPAVPYESGALAVVLPLLYHYFAGVLGQQQGRKRPDILQVLNDCHYQVYVVHLLCGTGPRASSRDEVNNSRSQVHASLIFFDSEAEPWDIVPQLKPHPTRLARRD